MVELADTPDLGSGAERLGGSNPLARNLLIQPCTFSNVMISFLTPKTGSNWHFCLAKTTVFYPFPAHSTVSHSRSEGIIVNTRASDLASPGAAGGARCNRTDTGRYRRQACTRRHIPVPACLSSLSSGAGAITALTDARSVCCSV